MSRKSKVNEKLCIMCEEEKEDVKAHNLLVFKKYLCDDCYHKKIVSTIQDSAIISAVYIIPLLITYIIDSAHEWKMEYSPFFITYIILSLITYGMFFSRSSSSSKTDSYFNDYVPFVFATGSSKEQNDALASYSIIKFLGVILKILVGGVLLPIIVVYNVTILINAILLLKNVPDKIRIPAIIASFVILAIIVLAVVIGRVTAV